MKHKKILEHILNFMPKINQITVYKGQCCYALKRWHCSQQNPGGEGRFKEQHIALCPYVRPPSVTRACLNQHV